MTGLFEDRTSKNVLAWDRNPPNAPKGLAFLALQSDLEELLGRKVDLVPKDGLHWVIRDRAIEDAEMLYAE